MVENLDFQTLGGSLPYVYRFLKQSGQQFMESMALLLMNMTEYRNFPKNTSQSLPYESLRKSIERFSL
jgi:hypothetical protein